MSLPSPISIGDAFALSNMAFKIAKSFLPGSNNAENEFKELHSLLCSLTSSLRLVGETFRRKDKSTDQRDTADALYDRDNTVMIISETLSNCNALLGDFTRFIETYSALEQASDSSSDLPSALGRTWSGHMRRQWMKIPWAAEGDNISGLKQSLVVHTQVLNLAISTANRSVILRHPCTSHAL